jgi:hypothetical protein
MGRKSRRRRRRAMRRVMDLLLDTAANYLAMTLRDATHREEDEDERGPNKNPARNSRTKHQN